MARLLETALQSHNNKEEQYQGNRYVRGDTLPDGKVKLLDGFACKNEPIGNVVFNFLFYIIIFRYT